MGEETDLEKKMLDFAQVGWDNAMYDFHFPPIPEPKFVFDKSRREGFHISPEEGWRVTLNLLEVPLFLEDAQMGDFLRSISHHEIGHYDICPYDGLMTAELISAAMKHVSKFLAPIVVNFFSDLIIDTFLLDKYFDLTLNREKSIIREILSEAHKSGTIQSLSRFWKILVKTYEIVWAKDLGLERVDLNDVKVIAGKIARIITKDFWVQATWPKKVTVISKLLKSTLEDDFTVQVGLSQSSNSRPCEGGDASVEIPVEVLETMGNPLEIKHKDKVGSGEDPKHEATQRASRQRQAEEFARNKSLNEFGAPAAMAGLIRPQEALATWYRGRAQGLIDIRIMVEQPSGAIPVYPLNWRVGDPIDALDVTQSLHVSPVLIPNITTRKWHHEQGPGIRTEILPPDMLIVLDSSGSMNWNPYNQRNFGQYDTALVAAFAALHFAANRGCKIGSINFSDRGITCDFTTQYELVEKNLLSYQGGGTEIPVKGMMDVMGKAEKHTLVLLITDFGIYNFSAAAKAFTTILDRGHKIVAFFIEGNAKELEGQKFKALIEKGAQFYIVKNVDDLVGLVIEEVQKFYDS